MKVVRHRLCDDEKSAVAAMAGALGAITPDAAVATGGLERRRASEGDTAFRLSALRAMQDGAPALSACLDRLRDEPGSVAIVDNLPLEAPAALMLIAGSLLGEVHEYAGHGAPVVSVSNKGKGGARPSSDNDLAFDLHTDMSFYPSPPEYLIFLLLKSPQSGGESLFCDAAAAVGDLSPVYRQALERPFRFAPPPHQPEQGGSSHPILTRSAGEGWNVRYRCDGLSPTDPAQDDALVAWRDAIQNHCVELALLTGELVIHSNTHVLHGRRAFRDGAAAQRLALRSYAEPPERLPADGQRP